MKNISKYLISAVALTVLLGSVLAVSGAKAAETGFLPFHQRFAQRFNLDEQEVENFFQETRKEMGREGWEAREEMIEERLSQAVEAGDLTSEEKQYVLGKLQEIEELKADTELSCDDKRETMQGLREEMREWTEENDIPFGLVMRLGGRGKKAGMGMGMGMRLRPMAGE